MFAMVFRFKFVPLTKKLGVFLILPYSMFSLLWKAVNAIETVTEEDSIVLVHSVPNIRMNEFVKKFVF